MYTPQVIEHYENPRNVGSVSDANGVAVVGSAAEGEMIKLTLKVVRGVIVKAKFRAFGCPTAIASASVLTEMVIGSEFSEALKTTGVQISEALGGLPPEKFRYADAASKVLEGAVADFMSKKEM